ncbi:hypothetical protein Cst_c27310 [Thermoclostridium stercorarium subsp. stercorarium DSM 8532]|uniref:Uncharacterized protein n=1 Tax=Thermoclostridium stercorarium (strain ATCC 35414 / DSM 8532 / NCIMB 11754) TaxID=1121335 RepID=L7VSW2_THES1|nr:hypothetical protein Cst_c27310 [Thermoclostridium stercorarium subsp. stercorarium DSM 8532]
MHYICQYFLLMFVYFDIYSEKAIIVLNLNPAMPTVFDKNHG